MSFRSGNLSFTQSVVSHSTYNGNKHLRVTSQLNGLYMSQFTYLVWTGLKWLRTRQNGEFC